MVQAQQWINEKFPNKEVKEKVKKLYIDNDQGVDSNNGRKWHFYITQIEGELSLNEFVNLECLNIRGSDSDIGNYQKLTKVDTTNCSKLKDFCFGYNDGQVILENSKVLENLEVENCPQLKNIPNLDKLTSLGSLHFYDCPDLTELKGLNRLNKLTSFSINEHRYIRELRLEYKHLKYHFNRYSSDNSKLTELDLTKMDKLNYLSLNYCLQLTKVEGLERLQNLNSLALNKCPKLPEPNFQLMTPLRKLVINKCPQFTCQPEKFPKELTSLNFGRQKISIYNLEKLANLTGLAFSSCSELKELTNLDKLKKLTDLHLYDLNDLTNLKGVGDLDNLTNLTIEDCSNLEKVEGLEKLVRLGCFNFQNCPKLKIFTPFEEWRKSLENKIKEVEESELKIKSLKIEKLEIENGKQKVERKLEESKRKNEELEKEKVNIQNELSNQKKDLENKISELRERQLNENEKKILQKLGELFKFLDNQLDGENVEELEKLIKECSELDFAIAPNLPEKFKVESQNLIKRANSFAKCYRELQLAKKETEQLKVENQQREVENKKKVEELNQKIKNLSLKIENDLVDNSEQGQQVIELYGKIEQLKKAENSQIISLQKQLDNAKLENKQLIESTKKENEEVIQTVEQKFSAQIISNKVQEQTIEKLKEKIEELTKVIENKEKIKILGNLDLNLENLEVKNVSSDTNDTIKPNIKIKNTNTMTNNTNTNEKIFILEWESAELKDKKMRCENFKVITGSEEENLLFYSTFFVDEFKFKKGEIYQLSTPGNFVKDTSGTIPGSFDTSGIIQGIDNGGYEFEKVAPSLLIKELWEEKEDNAEKLNISEEDLEKKKEEVDRINDSWLEAKNEVIKLQKKFDNLKIEKEKIEKEWTSPTKFAEMREEQENLKKAVESLQNQLNNLQNEKKRVENDSITPERHQKLREEKENLKSQLKSERKSKQFFVEELEKIRSQEWKGTIGERLQKQKDELEKLKVKLGDKLADNLKSHLETLLTMQKQLDILIFKDVDQSLCAIIKNQLQQSKDELIKQISSEEIEELCTKQTEVRKLEVQQEQWEKLESQQTKEEQFEAYEQVPPKK